MPEFMIDGLFLLTDGRVYSFNLSRMSQSEPSLPLLCGIWGAKSDKKELYLMNHTLKRRELISRARFYK